MHDARSQGPALRPLFSTAGSIEFNGAKITSDGGLLAYRELYDALGLTEMAITKLLDGGDGRNTRHELIGPFRQSCSVGSPGSTGSRCRRWPPELGCGHAENAVAKYG